MKIRIFPKFLFFPFLFFSSFYSFPQTKPLIQIYDSTKVCEGYIFYTGNGSQLIDRRGNTLFKIPGNLVSFYNDYKAVIVGVTKNGSLFALNKNLDVMWKAKEYSHHAMTVTHDDNVILLCHEYDSINHLSIQFDFILCLDSTGNELYKWSTFDHRQYLLNYMMKDTNIFRFKIRGSSNPDSILFNMACSLKILEQDSANQAFFHSNSIHVIPENESEKKDTAFRKGNLILNFNSKTDSLASFVAILDPVHNKILWHYIQRNRRPIFSPAILPNGHILMYLNSNAKGNDSSLVEEIDPITNEIIWYYTDKFTKIKMRRKMGSCQRLPNGNTLISNNNGYIYEVTPDKKIVWQWYANPLEDTKSIIVNRAELCPKEKLNWLIDQVWPTVINKPSLKVETTQITTPTLQIFDSSKVCDGYIMWQDLGGGCRLMDRYGKVLYSFPGNFSAFFKNKKEMASRINGNLVVYNKDLDISWEFKIKTFISHEIAMTPEDNVMLISVERFAINHNTVQFDIILCFDSTGKELYKWSTYDQRSYLISFMMQDTNIFRYKIKGSSDPDSVLFRIAPSLKIMSGNTYPELFHMNAIQVIPENNSEKKNEAFRKNNLLLSFCNYNDSLASFIAIVDPVSYKVLWYYVQKNRKPMHTPTMLPNGHILVYVNSDGYSKTDTSFVDEIDPITKEVIWSYAETFPNVWLRYGKGSCQRLPGGNTLISNANGYMYEITPENKIVWQWFASATRGSDAWLYKAILYPKEKLNWLVNDQ